MLPAALSQIKEPIFWRFLPLRHSISQHFIVLQMRDPNTIACADVLLEDVTANQLSSQVALFGMMRFCILLKCFSMGTVQLHSSLHYTIYVSISWYMAGYHHTIKRNNTIPGLLIKQSYSGCTLSNETTHFFEIYVTEAFNKSTFYCAAYERRPQERSCSGRTSGRCYSKPALFTGMVI